jgi:hypothetical protein
MAKQKQAPAKGGKEKTILTKIAGKVGYLAGGIAGRKDQLVEMAGDAIDSVKSTFQEMTSGKKSDKKAAPKAGAKKTATKTAEPTKRKSPVSATKKTPAAVKKTASTPRAKAPAAGKKVGRKPAKKAAPKKNA